MLVLTCNKLRSSVCFEVSSYFDIRKKTLRKTTSCKLKIRALKPRQQFCGDISTLFQSHCQPRMKYLQACYLYGRVDAIAVSHYTIATMILNKDREFF